MKNKQPELGILESIKKLAIIAIVSDDELMEQLVLKGGNAIDLIYGLSGRASMDIDFSMQHEFEKERIPKITEKLEELFKSTFENNGFIVFDFKFIEQPRVVSEELKDCWGGYRIEFKVISATDYNKYSLNLENLRKYSVTFGQKQERVFSIDISKFEYCLDKDEKELDNYTLYVYSPEMIVLEKIRAICQQIPEYRDIIRTHPPTARARDFFDIYLIIDTLKIDLNKESTINKLKLVFSAKRVPLEFIKKIRDQKEFHRPDFAAVQATVKRGVKLKDFDFYFDFVVNELDSVELAKPEG